jgi:hypothetical protein
MADISLCQQNSVLTAIGGALHSIISRTTTAMLFQLSHAEPLRFSTIISCSTITVYSRYLTQNHYDAIPLSHTKPLRFSKIISCSTNTVYSRYLTQIHYYLFPSSQSAPIQFNHILSHSIITIQSHYLTQHHLFPLSHAPSLRFSPIISQLYLQTQTLTTNSSPHTPTLSANPSTHGATASSRPWPPS